MKTMNVLRVLLYINGANYNELSKNSLLVEIKSQLQSLENIPENMKKARKRYRFGNIKCVEGLSNGGSEPVLGIVEELRTDLSGGRKLKSTLRVQK